jgi:hypothetical protein
MDELINNVAKKTGLSPEMAKTAVNEVINYLKQKLPAPIAAQIDGVLGGSGGNPLAGALGGILGKK